MELKNRVKNKIIIFMLIAFLALSGCTGSQTENSANEPDVDEAPATNDTKSEALPDATPVDSLSALRTELLAKGYNVTYIEEAGANTPQGVHQNKLVIHVTTRDDARYDIVDMATIAYEYYPDMDVYSTKCDATSSGITSLRPSYFVEKGAIVAYINGADKDVVKVR